MTEVLFARLDDVDVDAVQALVDEANAAVVAAEAAQAAAEAAAAVFTNEYVQDLVGAMFQGNTETRITVDYQDSDGTIDLVVLADLSQYDNTTSAFLTAASGGLLFQPLDDDLTDLSVPGALPNFEAPTSGTKIIVFEDGVYQRVDWSEIPGVAEAAGSFLGLNDTPDSFVGEAGDLVRVNATEDGLEFFTGEFTADAITFTPAGSIAATDVQAAIEELDAEKQPLDADLTAIAALATAAYGRSLLTLANATALAAEVDSFFLTPAEGNAAYQPLDSDLTSIAALSTTAYGRGLLTLADATALAAEVDSFFLTPAEGNAAYQPLDADLTSWAGVTRAAGFDTFAATPTSANLSSLLTDEAFSMSDAELGAIAGLVSAADRLPYFTGSGTASLATFTAFARTILDDADEATFKATVNLEIGVDVQAFDADLSSWAAVTRAAGFDTFVATPSSANLRALLSDEKGTGAALFELAGALTWGSGSGFAWTFDAGATDPVITFGSGSVEISSANLFVSTNGSSSGSPALFGMSNLTSGEYARWQFGDQANAIQNGFDQRMQIYAYHGIEIRGATASATAPSFVAGGGASDPSLSVIGNMYVSTSLDLGNLSDTTFTRVSAGVAAIEGNNILTSATGQPLDADLTAIAALSTTAAGRSVLTVADDNVDEIVAWDDSAGTMKTFALADFTTEASPANGDYLLIYGAEGDLRKADWSTLPGAAGIPADPNVDALLGWDDSDGAAQWMTPGVTIGISTSDTFGLGGGTTVLTDPNADRFAFWDDSAGRMEWLTPDSTLTISTTNVGVSTTNNPVGKQTIWVPANAMTAGTTGGPGTATIEINASDNYIFVHDFDGSGTTERSYFQIAMPKGWDEGTITYQVFWTVNASVTTVVSWNMSAVSIADNESLDGTFGTLIEVTDTAQSGAHELYASSESSALTIGGTPAEGEMVIFRIFRDSADASDTMTQDARLIGVKVFYTTNAATDA